MSGDLSFKLTSGAPLETSTIGREAAGQGGGGEREREGREVVEGGNKAAFTWTTESRLNPDRSHSHVIQLQLNPD